jgi:hypothetical protein
VIAREELLGRQDKLEEEDDSDILFSNSWNSCHDKQSS